MPFGGVLGVKCGSSPDGPTGDEIAFAAPVVDFLFAFTVVSFFNASVNITDDDDDDEEDDDDLTIDSKVCTIRSFG